MQGYNTLIIRNIDKYNNKLRPSDWVERLASMAGEFDNGRTRYDSRVMPCRRCDDLICLRVDKSIGQEKPEVLATIDDFMQLNELENFVSQCPSHAEAYAEQQMQDEISRLVHSANESEMPIEKVVTQKAGGNTIQTAA